MSGKVEKVNIVMSIYNPNIEFLKKQLKSLNEQDYKNIEILIWDDNPLSEFDKKILEKILVKFPYKYEKAKENIGYSKAFQYLTEIATGKYIAYCDQDDIWLSYKISKCVSVLEKESAILVTGDRALIDENDKIFVKSVRKEWKTVVDTWKTGDHMLTTAVFNTCSIGMNTVMRLDAAKSMLPIPNNVAHDKWFAAGAFAKGKVAYIDDVLVLYRRHGKNVSGTLVGISSKEEYYEQRILPQCYFTEAFIDKFSEISDMDKNIIFEFTNARKNHKLMQIFKYRKLAPEIAMFEICCLFIPNFLFSFVLKILQKIR